jgi:hypothetical protein
VLDDGDIRLHVVGDTGVMQFYHVLDVMARLLILAGRGDRVIAPDQAMTHDDGDDAEAAAQIAAVRAIDLDAIADPDVKAAALAVAEVRGTDTARAIYNAVVGVASKDDKAKQIELLRKAVSA